jgi:hypothetical protein
MFVPRLLGLGLLTVSMLFGVVHPAPGQERPAAKDPTLAVLEARASQFLEGVSLSQSQTACQELLAGSPLLKQTEALKSLVEKTKELEKKYGHYRAFEQIAAKHVGSDLVVLKYLYKCEQLPVVWYFTFYRTSAPGEAPPEKDAWRVITVRLDTELEALAN